MIFDTPLFLVFVFYNHLTSLAFSSLNMEQKTILSAASSEKAETEVTDRGPRSRFMSTHAFSSRMHKYFQCPLVVLYWCVCRVQGPSSVSF